MTAPDLPAFILARVAEDEESVRPRTVIRSGGWPAPDVLNCIGVEGRACPGWWALPGEVDLEPRGPHWWERTEVREAVRNHEMEHASPAQSRVLATCKAHRAIVELHDGQTRYGLDFPNTHPCDGTNGIIECDTLRALASVWSEHPEYDSRWSL